MKPNLAERAGRWSAAHWKTAAFGWLAFVAIAVVLGQALGVVNLTDTESATGETARAEAILSRAGFNDHAGESVLVQSRTRDVGDPAFQRTVKRVVAKLETLPTVRDVRSPLAHGREGQLSADRHSALVQFSISGSSDTADSRVQPVLNAGGQAAAGLPRLHRRRVRRGERRPRGRQGREQGPLARGEAVRAGHLPRAADRVRRVRGSRRAGAAGVLGRARLAGHRGRRQPPVPLLRRHQLGDAADRHGRGRGLLALLPQARARGAQERPRTGRRPRPCGRHLGPRRADLGRHRDDRDGRDAARRQQGLQLAGDRRDDRRLHHHGRLADRAARRAGQAGRPRGARRAGRARRRVAAPGAAAGPPEAARVAARPAHAAAAREGRPSDLAGLVARAAPGAALPRHLGGARGGASCW